MKKFYPFLIPAGLIIFIIVALYMFVVTSKKSTTSTTSNPLPPPTMIPVPFEYTVKRIETATVILSGQEGDLTLPKDDKVVTIMKGNRGSATPATFTNLAVGQQVNVDLVPGRAATVYILN